MNRSTRRIFATSLFSILVALSATAIAQEGRDVVGTWEGFSSLGNLVVIEITQGDDGALTAGVTVYEGGIGGTPRADTYSISSEHVDAIHTRFDVGGEMGTLDAYWYNDHALRLHVAEGVVVSLARVGTPDASALAWAAAAAVESPDPPAEEAAE